MQKQSNLYVVRNYTNSRKVTVLDVSYLLPLCQPEHPSERGINLNNRHFMFPGGGTSTDSVFADQRCPLALAGHSCPPQVR